jgi:hypothetical protein
MRTVRLALLLLVAVLSVTDAVTACGEKFALPGRCPPARMYAAVYPTTVLIDATPRAGSPAGIREAKFQSALRLAGHQVSHLENHAVVAEALKAGKVDLVLADLDDAVPLLRAAEGSPSHPIGLPVMMDKPTKAMTDACRADFGDWCQLKASDKPERFLTVIDDAMKARAKTRQVQKR